MSVIPDPATTYWVPMAGGTDLAYKGGYSSGVTYNNGDIVIGDDGLAYICVVDGTINSPPVPWQGAVASVGYGTSLPANPIHGQEFILVNDVTNPAWQWRFRYNMYNVTAYKWEFVGGSTGYNSTGTQQAVTPASTWVNSINGFTVPRPGIYVCRVWVAWFNDQAAGEVLSGDEAVGLWGRAPIAFNGYANTQQEYTKIISAAGVVYPRLYVTVQWLKANTQEFTVTPIRVS